MHAKIPVFLDFPIASLLSPTFRPFYRSKRSLCRGIGTYGNQTKGLVEDLEDWIVR